MPFLDPEKQLASLIASQSLESLESLNKLKTTLTDLSTPFDGLNIGYYNFRIDSENAFSKSEPLNLKISSNSFDHLKQQFEQSFENIGIRIIFIILRRGIPNVNAAVDSLLEHKRLVESLYSVIKDAFAFQEKNSDEKTNPNKPDERAVALHHNFPEYSVEIIETFMIILTIIGVINEVKLTLSEPLITTFQPDLKLADDFFNEHKIEIEQLEQKVKKIFIGIFPSLKQLYSPRRAGKKKGKQRKTQLQNQEAIFVDEDAILNYFLTDMTASWKKAERNIQNVKLGIIELGEIYTEYLTLYNFYHEISDLAHIDLIVRFKRNDQLSSLLKSIINSTRSIDESLIAPKEDITSALQPIKIEDRVVKLPNDSHALSAFSITSISREFDFDLPDSQDIPDDLFNAINTVADIAGERNLIFPETVVTSQLINLYFSQNLSALGESFMKDAINEKIPFEKIEQLLNPESEFYEFTNIEKIATYFSQQQDKSLIERVLRQSAARSFIGIDVLLKQNKNFKNEIVCLQNENQQLKADLEELKSDTLQIQQQEKISLLETQLEKMKTERDGFQKSFREVSRLISPFDELKIKYEEAISEINSLKQGEAQLLLENKRLSEVIESYLSDTEDDVEEAITNEAYLHLHLEPLLDKKIAIVGGHESWRTKIGQLLPHARIFIPEHVNVSLDMISRADIVILNTAMMNHSMFAKVKDSFHKNDKGRFVYINTLSSNMLRTFEIINEQL